MLRWHTAPSGNSAPGADSTNAARERPGLIPKPWPNAVLCAVSIPVIDLKTGDVVKP
ncbi:hypothetical protein [Arthrobacter sp. ES3-54]|uniref:hypothetical protein n=1 Tax=Arthrobacter sp. ES3-54 TaxID=1502991 RepID=UPI002406B8C0|nr:hypothetical protein [Arthrobacter sp. ES3-54]MDF9749071.1 hypothetical protein [Arthrobacter sp. ES3-54]